MTRTPSQLTMAFHPIVDVEAQDVWGYEALARGTGGESAGDLLQRLTDENRARFDQACRVKAVELAGRLMPRSCGTRVAINFRPDAGEEPWAEIQPTLDAAKRVGLAPNRIMLEFNETKRIDDVGHMKRLIEHIKQLGFLTAIDNFGSRNASLALIAKMQPDLIKIDMDLIRSISTAPAKQVIVAGLVSIANALQIKVLAEGVETASEVRVLRGAGIKLMQGYFFAQPRIAELPAVRWSTESFERRTA